MSGQVEIRRYRDGECFETITATNAIKTSYLKTLAAILDPNQSTGPFSASHFAVGNDSSPPEGELDGSLLGDERFRDPVDSTNQTNSGKTLEVTCTLGDTEANGFLIAEVGLVNDGSSVPINRIVLDDGDQFLKTSGEVDTFTFTLSLSPEEDFI